MTEPSAKPAALRLTPLLQHGDVLADSQSFVLAVEIHVWMARTGTPLPGGLGGVELTWAREPGRLPSVAG